MKRVATSVTITDPLIKYQTLVATGVCSPDAAQHRLAHHLQKIYMRLKDYTPAPEYRTRLRQIAQAVKSVDDKTNGRSRREKEEEGEELAVATHPIRRNPLFARFFQKAEGRDSLALTRVLTSHQAALQANSPRGLFLSGEVGTGKSMLLDLLAEGLPTSGKRRWHFNTFMLHAFSRLEQFRKSRILPQLGDAATAVEQEEEYSLLWLAREMIEESPILFLDEFQLPDRAASKLLNNLFIVFFQLGGVLIASSNRMPEELEKATGNHYAPPPVTGGLIEQVLGLRKRAQPGELFGRTSDFAAFLEVLKARCDFWHIEGVRDWRRRGHGGVDASALPLDSRGPVSLPEIPSLGLITETGDDEALSLVQDPDNEGPANYFLPADSEENWTKSVLDSFAATQRNGVQWQTASLVVYGRKVLVPRQCHGVTYWQFHELVKSFGPADYITLASNYHTFIIDQVPVLTLSMKNEARRFITFLDALYEARCKLIIRADAGPDSLFFPEVRGSHTNRDKLPSGVENNNSKGSEDDDATYSETIAEVFQDQMSPFRPNISTYADDSPNSKYDPDQDSDFGIEPTKYQQKIDFANASAFTGEDERFAYKRATSRLWELCSAHWHARDGDGWWQPLAIEARHWEGSEPSAPLGPRSSSQVVVTPRAPRTEITMGSSTELEEPAGLERFGVSALRKKAG